MLNSYLSLQNTLAKAAKPRVKVESFFYICLQQTDLLI